MTDPTSNTLNWADAPEQFRAAYERQQKELKEARDGATDAASTKRENLMLRAGIDMSDPAATYFVSGYDGKDDPDDVKAAWQAMKGTPATPPASDGTPPPAGPPGTPPPTNDDGSNPADVAAQAELARQRALLGNTGVPPGEEPQGDGQEYGIQVKMDRQKQGWTRENAAAAGIEAIFQRAADGDQTVVSTGGGGQTAAQQSVTKWRQKHGYE